MPPDLPTLDRPRAAAALGIALPISVTQSLRNRLVGLLREGERRYRILAENATDIVMSMSLDGRLTYVSPRAKAVMKWAPDDLTGVYYPDLVLPEDREALRRQKRRGVLSCSQEAGNCTFVLMLPDDVRSVN